MSSPSRAERSRAASACDLPFTYAAKDTGSPPRASGNAKSAHQRPVFRLTRNEPGRRSTRRGLRAHHSSPCRAPSGSPVGGERWELGKRQRVDGAEVDAAPAAPCYGCGVSRSAFETHRAGPGPRRAGASISGPWHHSRARSGTLPSVEPSPRPRSSAIRRNWNRAAAALERSKWTETFIGGREKNKHASKKLRAGRGAVGKATVVGAKDRESNRVSAEVVPGTDTATLQGFVHGQARLGATVYTDDHGAYRSMGGFHHEAVKHGVGEYVRAKAHTNGIESFWAMLKRGYQGVYHQMSAKHLQRYVNEFAGRHNIREQDTIDQMHAVVAGMVGKRLMYQELVGEG